MEKFCDLKYERPDLKKMKEEYLAAIAKFKAAATFDEANGALLECSRILDQVMSKQTVASIQQRQSRPRESASGANNAASVCNDISKFTQRDFDEIMRRAQRGERIRF